MNRFWKFGYSLSLIGAIALTGCSQGGEETVEVKFPDMGSLPKPTEAPKGKTAEGDAGPVSQGDPSQYSRGRK